MIIVDHSVGNQDTKLSDAPFRLYDEISDSGAPIPEPATTLLFGSGLTGQVGARIRRKK